MQPIIKQLVYDWAENLVCDWILWDRCFAQEKQLRVLWNFLVHSFIVCKDKTNSQAYSLIIHIHSVNWTNHVAFCLH